MLKNTRTIRIQWGDCDPAGIVFYPRYFEWFDACTILLFEKGKGEVVSFAGLVEKAKTVLGASN